MPEHWDKIREIIRAALERPAAERAAYVEEACAGDPALRDDLMAILNAETRAEGATGHPMLGPALTVEPERRAPASRTQLPKICPKCGARFDAGAVLCADDGEPLVDDPEALVHTTIDGLYRVERLLGRGGFGVVYLARHVLLRDLVAIKVLPRHFSSSPERVERFLREGRTARALHHPNAVTVYDLRVSDGNFVYMVQEYVDGRTLRAELDRLGRLSPAETLKLVEPVASALDEAHALGIVHRDLKPDNVMLGTVGGKPVVKLLDLGIAKLFEILNGPESGADMTHPGQVIGTPAYMSPEQWGDAPDDGGPDIDGRSDVYGLGVLVYEMIRGRKPFDAMTSSGLRRAHLTETPRPLDEVAPGTPPEFARAVARAMAKHRGDRQQTAGELVAELRAALGPALDSTTAPQHTTAPRPFAPTLPDPARRRSRSRSIAAAAAALALVAAAAALAWWLAARAPRPGPMSIRKVTHSGKVLGAALSPDARYVVSAVEEGAMYSLHFVQVASGNSVRIVEPTRELLAGLTFSPDGDFVYFTRQIDRRSSDLYKVPVVGGAPRKIVEKINSPVTFSPDGARIAFVRATDAPAGRAIFVANADGTAEQLLASRSAPLFYTFDGPAWSPDGEEIACSAGDHANGFHGYVVAVDVRTGAERRITRSSWFYVDRVEWVDGGEALVVSAADEPLGSLQLWRVDVSSGEAARVTNDLNSYVGVSGSRDGRSIVSVQTSLLTTIWVSGPGESQGGEQVNSGTNRYLGVSWTPDGRLLYSSFETGNPEIWISDAGGGERRQLTFDEAVDRDPVMSPDGRHIYFSSNRAGAFNIWRMDAEGGSLTRITSGDDEQYPSCTTDGRWVVHQALVDGVTTVAKTSVETGERVGIAAPRSYWPSLSPDGRWVACNQSDPASGQWTGVVLPIDGGTPLQRFDVRILTMPRLQWQRIRWTPDGRSVTYIDDADGAHNVWARPLGGGPPRRLTDYRSDQIFTYDIGGDGAVACARGPVASDAILISDF